MCGTKPEDVRWTAIRMDPRDNVAVALTELTEKKLITQSGGAILRLDGTWTDYPIIYWLFRQLRQRTDVPVAGGEVVTTPEEMRRLIDLGAYDICQPDATVLGGIGPVLAAGRHAKQKGVQTVVHALGGAACLMANYHCAFALGSSLAEYPIPPFPLRDELLAEPLVISGGMLRPPTMPGLGISLTAQIENEFRFRDDATYRGLALR